MMCGACSFLPLQTKHRPLCFIWLKGCFPFDGTLLNFLFSFYYILSLCVLSLHVWRNVALSIMTIYPFAPSRHWLVVILVSFTIVSICVIFLVYLRLLTSISKKIQGINQFMQDSYYQTVELIKVEILKRVKE